VETIRSGLAKLWQMLYAWLGISCLLLVFSKVRILQIVIGSDRKQQTTNNKQQTPNYD
jgi:hypothetical protein